MQKNTSGLHILFNRYESFNKDDISFILELIQEVQHHEYGDLDNKLFGLFDGYYYSDVMVQLNKVKEVSQESKMKFDKLLNKIVLSKTAPNII